MKKLFIGMLFIFTMSAFADYDVCVQAYQDAYVKLDRDTRNFNNRIIDKNEFATSVAAISTEVTIKRSICHFTEDPKIRACVKTLYNRYHKLRDKISVTSVLLGNQTEVEIGFLDQLVSSFNREFDSLRCELTGVDVHLNR